MRRGLWPPTSMPLATDDRQPVYNRPSSNPSPSLLRPPPPEWNRRIRTITSSLALACAATCLGQLVFADVAHALASAAASVTAGGDPLSGLLSFVLHLDKHLSVMITEHGTAVYYILFTIVFCETGLVLTPFLPGDSLLFAAGAFAGMGRLDLGILAAVFIVSAILGDAVNYAVGARLGAWAISKGMVKKEYVDKTEAFYDKYGGKTVVLARFVPIVRTFAPFVAGVGSMPYSKFALYNVLGAVVWTVLFVGAGFFFGNLPFVQKNFTLVVLAIVVVSVVPIILEVLAARREKEEEGRKGDA